MNTIPDCFSCWHKKLFGIIWMPIWCATFHSRDRIRIESWILEKVLKWICPAFSRPGKSLVNRDQVWKNGRVLSFFQSYNQPALYPFFFILVVFNYFHLHVCREKSFVPALFKVSFGTLFDSLESGKRKSLEKSWILDPKISMNPIRISSALQLHSFTEITIPMCDQKPKAIWYSVKIAWDHKLYLLLINYNIQLRHVLLIVSKHYLLIITKGRKVFLCFQ